MTKRSGVYSREAVSGVRRMMRKFGWYPDRTTVWHLVDTVDAQHEVIQRLKHPDGWQADDGEWVILGKHGDVTEHDEMSQAEQRVYYGRVIRPESSEWWNT